jgi:hypothetical protein
MVNLARRREVVKTSVQALLSVAVTGKEGVNGNRNQSELSLHDGARQN